MCLSYPGRVMSVHEDCVLVDEDGRRRRASRLLIRDLHAGDWVIVAAGAVIERLEPREAEEIIETLDAAVAAEENAAEMAAVAAAAADAQREAAARAGRVAAYAIPTGGRS